MVPSKIRASMSEARHDGLAKSNYGSAHSTPLPPSPPSLSVPELNSAGDPFTQVLYRKQVIPISIVSFS